LRNREYPPAERNPAVKREYPPEEKHPGIAPGEEPERGMCTLSNSETGDGKRDTIAHRYSPLSTILWEKPGVSAPHGELSPNSETGVGKTRNGNSLVSNCPFCNLSL